MDLTHIFEYGKQIELQAAQIIPVIIGIALTLIQCFFGFKLLRYIIALWGFALFGFVGYNIGSLSGQQTVGIAVCLVLGAVGAFIAYKYYKAGVFLQGFVAGFLIGLILGMFSNWNAGIVISAAIVIGILIGLLTCYLLKPMVILSSGFSGGMSAGAALAALFGFVPSVGVFVGTILTIIGIIYQFIGGSSKNKNKKSEKEVDNKDESKPASDETKKETSVENPSTDVVDTKKEPPETVEASADSLDSSEKGDIVVEPADSTSSGGEA